MGTDYETFYRANPHGLGAPSPEFVRFFDNHITSVARVLDVGCGQGRDALFIARLGHSVHAVDHAPSGISALRSEAEEEGLPIEAVVADIREYDWPGPFDVIVIDRTLHMLDKAERHEVFANLLDVTAPGAYVLIADQRSNLPGLNSIFAENRLHWTPVLERRGYFFARRD